MPSQRLTRITRSESSLSLVHWDALSTPSACPTPFPSLIPSILHDPSLPLNHARHHPERVNLVARPLGCHLDTARLPLIFMGFFESLPLRKPWPANFAGTPIEPGSDLSCVTLGAISGGGSSDGLSGGSNGSSGSSSSGNLRNGTRNATSAAVDSAAADSIPGDSDWVKKLGCHGPPCPSFGSCTARFPNVQACWNPHLVDELETEISPPINCPLKGDSTVFDETCSKRKDVVRHDVSALQVMWLEDVFVTGNGVNLNRTHAFVRNGCSRFPGTAKYEATHMVYELPALFNLAHQPGNNFYHFLVELVPLFLVSTPLMSSMLQNVPVLVRQTQVRWYEQLGAPLIGIPTHHSRLLPTFANDLFHADMVYKPILQDCDRPSRPLWQMLWRRHLLHPSGIILFNPDWTYHSHRPLSLAEAHSFPHDWVIVLTKRPEGQRRVMENFEEVEAEAVRRFGQERVVVFNGSLSILQASCGPGLPSLLFPHASSSQPEHSYHELAST
ncbi:unnamed protein product [Closterium sp. NIES-64]|nr:unnamed protein product [Closterium sp. NIES-64]